MKFSRDSSLKQAYGHPAGRDIIDKFALQLGRSKKWVLNPVVGNLRMAVLPALTGGRISDQFVDTFVKLLNEQPQRAAMVREDESGTPPWWKEAVFYQIYPRSFNDSDGDGIGDLAGITSQLDYLADLGIGALWLSPIFDSPLDDNGYDVRDYRKVLEEYGTLQDFDALVAAAHRRGIRVILDLVVNHTSDEHEWFRQALADPGSPYRDYYFFADQANNWESFFSGDAWNWYPEIEQHALRLFASKQMDLNWDNPRVRREVRDLTQFWLDRGVDGFRLDVINLISKQPGLPDGDSAVGELLGVRGAEQFYYGPKLHEYLAELNREVLAPAGAFTVGETPWIGTQVGKLLTDPARGELDLIFSFEHLETPGHVRGDDYRYDLNYLKQYLTEAQGELRGQYWTSLFLENHDNPRMISKVDPRPEYRVPLGKLLGTILLTLRGTPFLYQGQELGLVNQPFTDISQLRDVEALNRYQELLGTMTPNQAFAAILPGARDHARAPIPWGGRGFTTGTPWIEAEHPTDVWASIADPDSVYHHYRWLIWLRRSNKELIFSDVRFLDLGVDDYWSYTRGDRFLVQLNLGAEPLTLPRKAASVRKLRDGWELLRGGTRGRSAWELGPYEARVWRKMEQDD